MANVKINNEYQKRFTQLFNENCRRSGRWQVWSDFVEMAAISISNTLDTVNAPERQKMWNAITGRYDKSEMDRFTRMLSEVIGGIDDCQDQDFLGDLFMRLELGNDHNGQFFTPYNLSVLTAELSAGKVSKQDVERVGWISVSDPACGAGALLIAFANALRKRGINYQERVLFEAQDIDGVAAHMCYIQLSLLGCAGYVVHGDTLAHPATHSSGSLLFPDDAGGNVWYTPGMFMGVFGERRLLARIGSMFKDRKPEPEEQLTLFS